VTFAPAIPTAHAAFAEMGPVDVRIAVTHLPLARDRELARAVAIDAVLGGHDHDPILETDGAAVIVKAGADVVNVGQVVFDVGGCDGRVRARRERLIPVDARIAAAADVTALEARYAALAERELNAPVGTTPVPLDAREAVIRREPTGLGRYVVEVMRRRVGGDVGLLNSGAIRGNRVIPPGPVTRRDVHALLPFGNVIVLVEISGAALVQALEHSVDRLPRPAGHYLMTAGIEFVVDATAPPGARIGAVRVAGAPLDPRRTYRVALIEYLAQGKDNYPMLAEGTVLVAPEDGPGLVQAVLDAFAAGHAPTSP
jgi:2',3'-cyclic-nucleotide 2'-phosphodiesterase (5'-nucleotidase family)